LGNQIPHAAAKSSHAAKNIKDSTCCNEGLVQPNKKINFFKRERRKRKRKCAFSSFSDQRAALNNILKWARFF